MYKDDFKEYLNNLANCIRICNFVIFPTINTVR